MPLEQLVVLVPALIPVAYLLIGMVVYVFLVATGRLVPERDGRERGNFFDFFIRYFLWMLGPVERAFLALKLTPNQLTFAGLAACAGAGLAIGLDHMATAGWLYVAAGGLDILDGRLARATGRQTKSGAFLDSVSDRWGELFVFCGFAWFLRDSAWLLVVMLAASGSVMVSYTRARGEALGIDLSRGIMQRSERITLVAIGTLITAFFDAASPTTEYDIHVIGVALLLTAIGSIATAITRWVHGFRVLAERERAERLAAEEDEEESSVTTRSPRPGELRG